MSNSVHHNTPSHEDEVVTVTDHQEKEKEHLSQEDADDELALLTQKLIKIRNFGLSLKIHLTIALLVSFIIMIGMRSVQ